jgi:hypothetical protein
MSAAARAFPVWTPESPSDNENASDRDVMCVRRLVLATVDRNRTCDLRRVWLVTTLIERLRNRRNAARRADAIARALQTDPAPVPDPKDPPAAT